MSKKDWETNGYIDGIPIYCPSFDITCPYCCKNGLCHLINPENECDEWFEDY